MYINYSLQCRLENEMSGVRHLFTPMNETTRPSLHAFINAHIIKVGESLTTLKGKVFMDRKSTD